MINFLIKDQFKENSNNRIEFNAIADSVGNFSDQNNMLTNQTEAQQSFVTYVIASGNEILIHRFEIDLEDGQDVEAVIENLDGQMEAMHGRIVVRMD